MHVKALDCSIPKPTISVRIRFLAFRNVGLVDHGEQI